MSSYIKLLALIYDFGYDILFRKLLVIDRNKISGDAVVYFSELDSRRELEKLFDINKNCRIVELHQIEEVAVEDNERGRLSY